MRVFGLHIFFHVAQTEAGEPNTKLKGRPEVDGDVVVVKNILMVDGEYDHALIAAAICMTSWYTVSPTTDEVVEAVGIHNAHIRWNIMIYFTKSLLSQTSLARSSSPYLF